ncbi:hypothetical protein, partial [Mycobacterium sp. Lab-001]|uniref:hypothetical protein n=1 Tax=Mycobacterium sp. Lab-001 TaxID=3410136 RepID=UPI003D167420
VCARHGRREQRAGQHGQARCEEVKAFHAGSFRFSGSGAVTSRIGRHCLHDSLEGLTVEARVAA